MRPSPISNLKALSQAVGFLRKHPFWTLGLSMTTMALFLLGPALQIKLHLPEDPMVAMLLTTAAMLPMELYFVPRFLLMLDAEALDHPHNPRDAWRATFEVRWMKTFLAKMLLSIVAGVAANCLLVPGLIVLLLFGWTPLRVLLRGESIKAAATASLVLAAKLWPQILFVASTIIAIFALAAIASSTLLLRSLSNPPTAWEELSHPSVWFLFFLFGIMNLWLSTAFLALYHRVELDITLPEAGLQK